MFILSRGLIRTGAVNFIAARVSDLAGGNRHLALLTVMATVGLASAFINNTPVVVLFIPIIFSITCTYQLSPSKFLIPMSYASILGGMCTLIGTSTNIIVSDLSIMSGLNGLGMFELAPLGVPIALLGLIFIFVASPRLMPQHKPRGKNDTLRSCACRPAANLSARTRTRRLPAPTLRLKVSKSSAVPIS
jgi:di/tricarboxylate transporter